MQSNRRPSLDPGPTYKSRAGDYFRFQYYPYYPPPGLGGAVSHGEDISICPLSVAYVVSPSGREVYATPPRLPSLPSPVLSTPDATDLQEVTPRFVFPLSATGSGRIQRHGRPDDFVHVGGWAIAARYNVTPPPPGRCVECTVVHDECFWAYRSYLSIAATATATKTTSIPSAAPAERQLPSRAALRYIWSEGLWCQPWNRAWTRQSMRPLPRERFLCSKAALSHVLISLGMTDFATMLPWETVTAIFGFSSRALLWRIARAATLALAAKDRGEDVVTLVPALDIVSWRRGEDAAEMLRQSAKNLPLIRFTIDSQGISQIERIERLRRWQFAYTFQDTEYLVVEKEELKSVDVVFKSGRARLRILRGHPGFTTWDVPRPPPAPRLSVAPSDHIAEWNDNGTPLSRMCGEASPANRFQVVPLHGATGLTFIFDRNYLAAIHAHTPRQPISQLPYETHFLKELGGSAMDQFSRLAWVYLPLPPGDRILSMGFGSDGWTARIQRPCMIVHTQLGGTIFIGHIMPSYCPCMPFAEEPELLFTRLQVSFVSAVGAFSTKPLAELKYAHHVRKLPKEMIFEQGGFKPFRLTSYAPLDDITRVDIIEDPISGELRGLLFHYADGAQRAVGQYRIGYHTVKTFMHPASLCIRRRPRGRSPSRPSMPQMIRATASPSCHEGHETHTRRRGCACYRLTGFVRVQFDDESISLRFATRELEPADAIEGLVLTPPSFEPLSPTDP